MSEAEFRLKRRQQFLNEKYFRLNHAHLRRSMELDLQAIYHLRSQDDLDPVGQGAIFKSTLKLVRLEYTAGAKPEMLRPLYGEVIRCLQDWHQAEREYSQHLAKKSGKSLRLDITPLEFRDLFHFQLALDVISLGLLLGEGDAVRQAVTLMNSARGTDMLFEALVEPAVTDPRDVEEFFHEVPYGPLVDAMYTAETPAEASAFVKQYLEGWYKSFEGVPWHNGHLVVTDEYSNYEGYWAFEAAAVCVIYGIDDSSFRDHLVYPKDLADWAREHGSLDKIKPSGSGGTAADVLKCDAGQPCPKAGLWSTPAAQGLHAFLKGQVMPEMTSDYGLTIWQFEREG